MGTCWGNLTNCGEVTCDGLASRPGGVEILLAASCYRNRDKLQQLWASLGSKASLYFFFYFYKHKTTTTKPWSITKGNILILSGSTLYHLMKDKK